MPNNRKAITAIINGALYIDPSDVNRIDLNKIKSKFKHDIPVIVAPIHTWMPKSGPEALAKEVMKDLGIYKK